MLRYLTLLCMLDLAASGIIRGRILLDGDITKSVRLPVGSSLAVQLQDTSIADAPAITLQQITMPNLFAFPLAYQLEVPTNKMFPGRSHSLSARIMKGETLLYINDRHIGVPDTSDSPLMIDIPVISVNLEPTDTNGQTSLDTMEDMSWPEMVGREGTYAVNYIKEKSGLSNVFTVLENSPMTMDYRTDRVRVIVNQAGIVTQVPRTG